MNKVRTVIQGLIFSSILLLATQHLHAFGMQANAYWGTGFSGGMQGCMGDYDAYGDAAKEIQTATRSRVAAKDAYYDIKAEIKKLKKKKKEFDGSRAKNSAIAAIKNKQNLLDVLSSRAKQVGVIQGFSVDENGIIDGTVGLDGDEDRSKFDEDSVLGGFDKCPSGKPEDAVKIAALDLSRSIFTQGDYDAASNGYKYSYNESTAENPIIERCTESYDSAKTYNATDFETFNSCINREVGDRADLGGPVPGNLDAEGSHFYKNSCDKDKGIDPTKFCQMAQKVDSITSDEDWDSSDCADDVDNYMDVLARLSFLEDLKDKLGGKNGKGGLIADSADRIEEMKEDAEGDVCVSCLERGYETDRDGPSTTQTIIGALAGLTGQYLGLRAYKSAQSRAIDTAAQLGHTMRPIPNFNLYSGLGLSAISAISGLASGAYMCSGTGPYGGVNGMNNPYAMQMAMMGRGGAFGYPWGQNMSNPFMGMYMPGGFGQMGPMGLGTPFHMMGQMNPMMMGMGPYQSMMGPSAMFNPMAGLGMLGMMGMPGANFGIQGSFNPYGTMSPYAMMSPFGAGSAYAGLGAMAGNPWQMMNPSLMGNMGGLMSCIQAPCGGQLYNPFGMGVNGQMGLGLGAGGLGNVQGQQQMLQMQMQMLQQQQQQQMAYYQQVQQQTQRRMQAAQQLTQLQQQMQQLNMQASQIASQVGGLGSTGVGIGTGIGTGIGIPGLGLGLGVNLGIGGYGNSSMLWGGYPYGLGQFSPNSPGTNASSGVR